MRKILVLFDQDWDQAQLKKAVAMDGVGYRYFYEGFDLFSFPSNAQLLVFDIFRFVDKLVEKYRRVKLDGIISSHEQFGALSAALLATRLGLPTTSVEGVLNAQHKALARTIIARDVPEASVPFFSFPYTVRSASEIGIPFPFFVKPIKAAYSVLARRVEDFADLRDHLTFHPWEKYIIKRLVRPFNDVVERVGITDINGHYMLAEQLIDGFQVNVDGFVENGQVNILGIVDAVMYPGTDAFMRFEYPSRLPPDWQSKVRASATSVIKALSFDHGLFNIELKICSHSGDCKLIEVNPRMAAQLSTLYEMVDGINLHQLALMLALGQPVDARKKSMPDKFATSFVYRRFDGLPQPRFPDEAQLQALKHFDPDSQLVVFKKDGGGLKREMKWLRSHRFACLNLAAESEAALQEKYQRASALLGFPAL